MAARGRYTLVRKIADGGTAEVFLAHMEGSAGFRRLVVLKRVLPALWADENFRKGLIDEAHIAMALHHTNIVQVLDIGVASDRYFLVFELVNGWTLSQIIKRTQAANVAMPLNLALHVMAEVCRALAYAHSRTENGVPLSIVHRDVTPQNVMLSEQGEVKLTDFGIARARTRATTSQVGTVKGKPAFMSPEQAQGQQLDARSDLFPIGTMLYQLVTGELPFGSASSPETMRRIISGQYIALDLKRPDLPVEFARLIATALKKNVADRFQSADELLHAIEKVQRTVLVPAGQTELKAWLADLSAKDGALPLVNAATAPPPLPAPAEPSNLIELKDEDIVFTSEQPAKPPRRWWRHALLLVAATLAIGGLYAHLRTAPLDTVTPSSPLEVVADAAVIDTGLRDAGLVESGFIARVVDAGITSVGVTDAGTTNAGVVDAGVVDAGVVDAGVVDAGVVDAGVNDAGVNDAGVADAGVNDAGVVDAGVVDAGVVDAGSRGSDRVRERHVDSGVPKPVTPLRGANTPAPRAAAPDEMVSVLIETEPPGASLRIDRKVFGKTPIPIRLKVGITFELELVKPGYRTTKVQHFVTRRSTQRVHVAMPKCLLPLLCP